MLKEARTELICLADSEYKTAFGDIAHYLHALLDNCRAM